MTLLSLGDPLLSVPHPVPYIRSHCRLWPQFKMRFPQYALPTFPDTAPYKITRDNPVNYLPTPVTLEGTPGDPSTYIV